MEQEIRTAVLLCGFLRTADITHNSLIDNVISPNKADVFYFGPNSTDSPTSIHKGILDGSGFLKINPKNDAHEVFGGVEEKIRALYGNNITKLRLHDKKFDDFVKMSSFIDKKDWLFNLNPARFVSMFFNMQGAFRLMKEYEEKEEIRYDRVIITRPDLSFYAAIDLSKVRKGFVYMPSGEGFCPHTGNRNYGLSHVLPYRKRDAGKMVQTGVGFNDQVMAFNRDSAESMSTILDSAIRYMKEKIPLTPETILYYHLVANNGLRIKYTNDWPYEIVRSDDKNITTVTDLMILDLVDRYHPVVKERMKERPIKYFLKFSRIRLRALKTKYFR